LVVREKVRATTRRPLYFRRVPRRSQMTPRARPFLLVFTSFLLLAAGRGVARADRSADCANPWWKDYPRDHGRTYEVTIENVTGGDVTRSESGSSQRMAF